MATATRAKKIIHMFHLINAFNSCLLLFDVLGCGATWNTRDQTRRKRCIRFSRLKVDWHTTCYMPCHFIVCEKFMLCDRVVWHGLISVTRFFRCYHGVALTSARKCFAPLVWKLTSDTKTIPLKLMGFLVCFNHLLSSKNRAWLSFCSRFFCSLALLCMELHHAFTRPLFTFVFDHRINVCMNFHFGQLIHRLGAGMFDI